MRRTHTYLALADGTKHPSRITSVGVGKSSVVFSNNAATHTATVNLSDAFQHKLIVNDGAFDYLILEVSQVMGRLRLELERQGRHYAD